MSGNLGGLFALGFIAVWADLVGDDFNGFFAYSSGYWVALFLWNDEFDGKGYWSACFSEGWCAYLGLFDNIDDWAVMFWLFITVCWGVVWGGVSVSWGSMSISWSWVSISWSVVDWVGWAGSSCSEYGEDGNENLKVCKWSGIRIMMAVIVVLLVVYDVK